MEKLKPVPKKEIYHGCLNCGGTSSNLKMNTKIIAGFGIAQITRNGKTIYLEEPNIEWKDAPTLLKFELMARKKAGDWRYILNLPLRDAEYQRQGKNKWILVKSGMGFA